MDDTGRNSAQDENVLPRITPEMAAIVERLDASRGPDVPDEAFLTWSQQDSLKEDLYHLLRIRLMEGNED